MRGVRGSGVQSRQAFPKSRISNSCIRCDISLADRLHVQCQSGWPAYTCLQILPHRTFLVLGFEHSVSGMEIWAWFCQVGEAHVWEGGAYRGRGGHSSDTSCKVYKQRWGLSFQWAPAPMLLELIWKAVFLLRQLFAMWVSNLRHAPPFLIKLSTQENHGLRMKALAGTQRKPSNNWMATIRPIKLLNSSSFTKRLDFYQKFQIWIGPWIWLICFSKKLGTR